MDWIYEGGSDLSWLNFLYDKMKSALICFILSRNMGVGQYEVQYLLVKLLHITHEEFALTR